MSLDDKIFNERLVSLTVDGLETVYMASECISQNGFPRDDQLRARAFMREYDSCVMYQRPSGELRENFERISQILVRKAKSSSHELLNFVKLTCAGGAVYGILSSLNDMFAGRDYSQNTFIALFGFLGFGISRVAQNYLNAQAARRLHADAARVIEAPDMIWSAALTELYDRKFRRGYSD
ncbi:MAG: hypothetical protein QW165_04665 [Candidatus Woesearchaeota archaeon]